MSLEKPKSEFKISTDQEASRFEKFLALFANERIIFSGIFGSGKTYFLKEFFESRKDQFLDIHLYPTNYSVSSNEDIFDYIKYDILYELISNKPNIEKVEMPVFDALNEITAEEYYSIFKEFVEAIPEIGKKVTDILKPLESSIRILKKRIVVKDDGKAIEGFHELIKAKRGSIYENDFYTELITGLVTQFKTGSEINGSGKERKVVLIVDDIDRIDPEHLFRILNVLAVHFDNRLRTDGGNKFGIDQIILRCDINNVRSIFKSRYGQTTDFSGYIDKFYSREIFHFDNRKLVSLVVTHVLMSMKGQGSDVSHFKSDALVSLWFYEYLLIAMIDSNALNLRTLVKLLDIEFPVQTKRLVFWSTYTENQQMPVTILVDFLLFVFGTTESLIDAVKKTHFIQTKFHHIMSFSLELILLIDWRNHSFRLGESTYHQEGIKYQLYDTMQRNYNIRHGGGPMNLSEVKFKTILELAIKEFVQITSYSQIER